MELGYEHVKYMDMLPLNLHFLSLNNCLPHWHGELELILVIKGCLSLETPSDSYTLHENDMVLINSYEMHSLKPAPEPNIILRLQFSMKLLKDHFASLSHVTFLECCVQTPEAIQRWLPIRRALLNIVDVCLGVSSQQDAEKSYGKLRVLSALYELIYRVVTIVPHKILEESELVSNQKNANRVSRILADIEKNYFKKLQLSDYAERENVSLYHLSHVFREVVGMSFRQYLGKVRLEHATSKLLYTDMSYLEISIECGYSDVKYLRQAFQQEYNCSISEYRIQNRAMRAKLNNDLWLLRSASDNGLFHGENASFILKNGNEHIVLEAHDKICTLLKEDRDGENGNPSAKDLISSKLICNACDGEGTTWTLS